VKTTLFKICFKWVNLCRYTEDILTDTRGLAFSRNKVTVSTSGLVPEIERYLTESQASLAVSLNATTDEIRSWIMPINRKYNLERLLGVLKDHFPRQDMVGALYKLNSAEQVDFSLPIA
jgi:23S rRNA (adenine2503-C2)-methyltransferase